MAADVLYGCWSGFRKGRVCTYKKAFAQTGSNLVAKIINLSTALGVRGCTLLLEVFGVAVENLEIGRSGRLDSIGPTWLKPPTKSGSGKEGPERSWLHS